MEETQVLKSNKKLWALVLACVVGTALLLSISNVFPVESLERGVFKALGMLVGALGIFVLGKDLMRNKELQLPITSSVWFAVNRAEQIVLERDIDRAMLEDILCDLRDYETRYKIVYPPILEQRIVALEKKLRK